jgi:hypothetical protein
MFRYTSCLGRPFLGAVSTMVVLSLWSMCTTEVLFLQAVFAMVVPFGHLHYGGTVSPERSKLKLPFMHITNPTYPGSKVKENFLYQSCSHNH